MSRHSISLLLALTVLAGLILELSHGATAPPVGTVGTVDNLQLRGNDAVKESVLQKNEALDVSDVTRENSKAGDSVRAPKVLESRSLSDSSDTAQIEEAAAAPEEKPAPEEQPAPIKKKNIWHQLSGIVTGNKGASPSPARQPSEAAKEQEPVQRRNIWHQLSGIVIGGKPASPSPARTAGDASEALRDKSLSRGGEQAAFVPTPTSTGRAPTVPAMKEAPAAPTLKPYEAKPVEQGAKTVTDGNFTVNIYPVEDPNTVRWAPIKLDDEVLVPVYFKPKPKHLKFDKNTKDVTLVGSWSNWQDHFKLQPKGTDCWDGVVNLPVGRHTFKFIVDDQWCIVGQWPVEKDENGDFNNVIEIPEPSNTMLMQERKSILNPKKKKFGFF